MRAKYEDKLAVNARRPLKIYQVVPMLCQSVTEKHTNSEEMEEQEGGEEEQKETTLEEGEKSYHVAEKGKGKRKGPLREGRKSRAGSRGMATDREWEAK